MFERRLSANRLSHPQNLIAINLLLGDIFDNLLPGVCHLADVSYANVRDYNQFNQPRGTAITNDRRKMRCKAHLKFDNNLKRRLASG